MSKENSQEDKKYTGKKTSVIAITDYQIGEGESITLWGVVFIASIKDDELILSAEIPEDLAKEMKIVKRVK